MAPYTGHCCASPDLHHTTNPSKQTNKNRRTLKWNVFVVDRHAFVTFLELQQACSRLPWSEPGWTFVIFATFGCHPRDDNENKTERKITFFIIPLLFHCSSQVDCVDYSTKGKWIDPQPLQSFVPVSLGKIWNPTFLQVAVPSAVMECNKVHLLQYNFELPLPILKSSFT